ncbi:MAG: flagellar motor switch protein FliN [Candidatus Xenobium sp.]
MDSYARGTARRGVRTPAHHEPPEDLGILFDVPLVVEAEMGRTHRTVRDILKIAQGSLIELDKESNEPVELRVNGQLVARGEVVEIDGNYGVRITEITRTS